VVLLLEKKMEVSMVEEDVTHLRLAMQMVLEVVLLTLGLVRNRFMLVLL
jgi:hypothetical protein